MARNVNFVAMGLCVALVIKRCGPKSCSDRVGSRPGQKTRSLLLPAPLESEPQSELYLPLRRAGPEGQSRAPTHTSGDLGRIGIDRERRRLGLVLDVEHVECLEAQLQVPSFVNRDALEQREIHVDNVRPSERIASQVSECARVVRDAERALNQLRDGAHLNRLADVADSQRHVLRHRPAGGHVESRRPRRFETLRLHAQEIDSPLDVEECEAPVLIERRLRLDSCGLVDEFDGRGGDGRARLIGDGAVHLARRSLAEDRQAKPQRRRQ